MTAIATLRRAAARYGLRPSPRDREAARRVLRELRDKALDLRRM